MLDEKRFEKILAQAKKAFEEKSVKDAEELKQRELKEKEVKETELKNLINSWILKSENIKDLEAVKELITEKKLNFLDFSKDFNAKKSSIEKEIKLKEDQKKLNDDKIDVAKEKIQIIKTTQELNEYVKSFDDNEYIKEALNLDYSKKFGELYSLENPKTPAVEKKVEKTTTVEKKVEKTKEEIKPIQSEEKKELYKKFLEKNNVLDWNVKDWSKKLIKDEEEKTITLYKRIDTFSY